MKNLVILISLLCIFVFPVATPISGEVTNDVPILASDLTDIKVAIFNGSTTEISESCKNATKAMYEWMNASVTYINAEDVKNDVLYRYDIFVIPPGNLPEYSINLGSSGKAKIREYVKNGGSVIGISRGAHFSCEIANVYGVENNWGLNLFNGTGRGPVGGYIDPYMYQVDINKTIPGLDLSTIPDSVSMMGWESIRFEPDGNVPFNVIASYPTSGNLPAMISYEYGHGCVFLSGIHPEFEEDNDRDHTAFFDFEEDPETDWPLMQEVSNWLVETSTWDNASISSGETTPSSSSTTSDTSSSGIDMSFPIESFLLAGGVGVVVIVALLIVINKRR